MRFKVIYEYYSPFHRRMQTSYFPSKMTEEEVYTREEADFVLNLLGRNQAARARLYAVEFPHPEGRLPEILNFAYPHAYLDQVAQEAADAEAEDEF